MNTTRKGAIYERRSMAVLARAGYDCVRSSASASLWDIWGKSATGFVLCQVKYGRWPGAAEMEALMLDACPPGTLRLVHRWRRGAALPDVRVVV